MRKLSVLVLIALLLSSACRKALTSAELDYLESELEKDRICVLELEYENGDFEIFSFNTKTSGA